MRIVVIRINGKDIAISAHEIPSLLQRLIQEYSKLVAKGEVSGAPRAGYVTYGDCEQVLSGYYADTMLRYHAGRLWGAIWNLTRYGEIAFDIICTICSTYVKSFRSDDSDGCFHNFASVGYRMNIVSRSSIIANFESVMNYHSKPVGDSVKRDYLILVRSLQS